MSKRKSDTNTDKLILTQHDAAEQMSKRKSVQNTDKLILRLQSAYEQKNNTRYARRAITYKLLPTNLLTI
ncbi:hypothetical protein DPMN_099232 [Dreissena polymorpha]|uniref:Uncharacterized protein n=1 Tax=Dreissena polymorpha TaxID=45954 RepID=A0A9D4LDP1_DREPO|nr:hypothetical protein DPMN_099232 [Dreissena polymorpha]